MKFVQFPNGKVWRVQEDGTFSGTVFVPEFAPLMVDNADDVENALDAISEAATGSITGLSGFSYRLRGDGFVSFSGVAEELPADEVDFEAEGFKVLPLGSDALIEALMAQYSLLRIEAEHAVANIDNVDLYSLECTVDILGSARQMRCPAHPQECSYVRVVIDELEIAYWVSDEWGLEPSVMGAILGAAKGGSV